MRTPTVPPRNFQPITINHQLPEGLVSCVSWFPILAALFSNLRTPNPQLKTLTPKLKTTRRVFQASVFPKQKKSLTPFGIKLLKNPAACYSPTSEPGSTLADEALHFRVRNGNGCYILSMATGKAIECFW